MSDLPSSLQVVLMCRALPVFEESAVVGLQDKQQAIRKGSFAQDGSCEFACEIQLRDKGNGFVDFAGPFVHGPLQERFLYLSWKRTDTSAAPWIQRVKVPLRFAASDLAQACVLRADVTGRKPHARESVEWQIA